MDTIRERHRNWLGHILRGSSFPRTVLEERMEGSRTRRKPMIKMLDHIQGRSQKFVLGGYKSFWGWIKLLNSRSDVIFTPQKVYFG